jgi:hypothetical protein
MKKNGERLGHADQWIRFGKEGLAEGERGHLAIEQEVVPLDRRTDRAGDHGAAQVRTVVKFGKVIRGRIGGGHRNSSPASDDNIDCKQWLLDHERRHNSRY